MKILSTVLIPILGLTVASCIQKEPLNAECDILSVTLPGDVLARTAEPENDRITLIVKNHVNITELAPEFTLTPGATIQPESGTIRNFTTQQTYVVTSEDGEWHKTYTITVERNKSINLNYNFSDVRVITTSGGATYDEFYSETTDPETGQTNTTIWASGNSGFALTNGNNPPSTYPTFQISEGYDGACACLITRSTGPWGAIVDKPIAAGNLFIGRFDTNLAVAHPMEATKFGEPFMSVPTYCNGYYKYTPGEMYQIFDKDKPSKLTDVPGKKDECNIYAVFFEATDDMEYLDGTNVLSDDNPNIIAVARFSNEQKQETPDWTYFHLPFEFREGASIDPDKLINGKYSLTIVMSSSTDGDYFSGAVGSCLLVDEVSIECR